VPFSHVFGEPSIAFGDRFAAILSTGYIVGSGEPVRGWLRQ
jgi:hypothetical protein